MKTKQSIAVIGVFCLIFLTSCGELVPTSGPVGTQVQAQGYNLPSCEGNCRVTIGGINSGRMTNGCLATWSPDLAIFSIPNALVPGIYDVVLDCPYGKFPMGLFAVTGGSHDEFKQLLLTTKILVDILDDYQTLDITKEDIQRMIDTLGQIVTPTQLSSMNQKALEENMIPQLWEIIFTYPHERTTCGCTTTEKMDFNNYATDQLRLASSSSSSVMRVVAKLFDMLALIPSNLIIKGVLVGVAASLEEAADIIDQKTDLSPPKIIIESSPTEIRLSETAIIKGRADDTAPTGLISGIHQITGIQDPIRDHSVSVGEYYADCFDCEKGQPIVPFEIHVTISEPSVYKEGDILRIKITAVDKKWLPSTTYVSLIVRSQPNAVPQLSSLNVDPNQVMINISGDLDLTWRVMDDGNLDYFDIYGYSNSITITPEQAHVSRTSKLWQNAYVTLDADDLGITKTGDINIRVHAIDKLGQRSSISKIIKAYSLTSVNWIQGRKYDDQNDWWYYELLDFQTDGTCDVCSGYWDGHTFDQRYCDYYPYGDCHWDLSGSNVWIQKENFNDWDDTETFTGTLYLDTTMEGRFTYYYCRFIYYWECWYEVGGDWEASPE